MATAKPAVLINTISGRIGNLVFYTRPLAPGTAKSRGKAATQSTARTQCVRTYVVPRNPDTISQRAVRRCFAEAVRAWQSLAGEDRNTYNRKARYINMSGYNLFISKFMKINIPRVNPSNPLFKHQKAGSRIPIHSVSALYVLPTLSGTRSSHKKSPPG